MSKIYYVKFDLSKENTFDIIPLTKFQTVPQKWSKIIHNDTIYEVIDIVYVLTEESFLRHIEVHLALHAQITRKIIQQAVK